MDMYLGIKYKFGYRYLTTVLELYLSTSTGTISTISILLDGVYWCFGAQAAA